MKKLLILICLLFLTGCSVSYEITLENNKIKERLTIVEKNQSLFDVENDTGSTLREIFDTLASEESDEFSVLDYSVESLNSDTQLGVEYYSDSTQSLINSSAINQCYMNPKIQINDNIVTFNTGNDFTCYDYYENLETINVVLTTEYKVLSSNADMVEGNKYIWNITKEGNKNIELSYEQYVFEDSPIGTIILVVALVVIFSLVALYVYKKKTKENKI